MNHCVPNFDMDEHYSIPASSSALNTSKKAAMGEEDIMELLWQGGQVVLQTQTQRSVKESLIDSSGSVVDEEITTQQQSAAGREIRSIEHDTLSLVRQQLFMHEDEMASWLNYSINDSSLDRDIYSELLYPPLISAPITTTTSIPSTTPTEIRTSTITTEIRHPLPPPPPPHSVSLAPRPPIPPPSERSSDSETTPKCENFMHFSRLPKTRVEPGPSSSSKAPGDLTVVESNDILYVGHESRISQAADSRMQVSGGNVGCGTMSASTAVGTSTAGREFATTCELTISSSPGGSCGTGSASVEPPPIHRPTAPAADDRKRKGREPDEAECHSEDIELESADGKKQVRGSTYTKRTRAAEVHNLSERRRRDRINEKMRALQELIPRCNKSDKASMLDEAIEYLKSLQLQVQMMSMGCGMLPTMYPGVQQYIPAMGMGMGMGRGMEMGMNRPMMPYPSLIPGSAIPTRAAAATMGPRFPVSAFPLQSIPVPDPSRLQTTSLPYRILSSQMVNNPNQPQLPNFSDPYQQFTGLRQAPMSVPQSQVVAQPLSNTPSCTRDVGNPQNKQTG